MSYDYRTAIPEPVRADILNRLAETEREEGVKIILAVESGSRAWGFPSADSDYDVRFIYAHPRDWYLSVNLERKRDVIDYPIVDLIDIGGWDLRKALGLLHRSNPAILEWLQSPIIYREQTPIADSLRSLLSHGYSPEASFYHYRSMAKGTYRDHLQGEQVKTKKYFYALRPLLAAIWVEKGFGPAPMEFGKLADRLLPGEGLRAEVERLRNRKRTEGEAEQGSPIPALNDFIARELERLENVHISQTEQTSNIEELNGFFRQTLEDMER